MDQLSCLKERKRAKISKLCNRVTNKTQVVSHQAGVEGKLRPAADTNLQTANGQSVPLIASGCTIESLDGERFKPTDRVCRRY